MGVALILPSFANRTNMAGRLSGKRCLIVGGTSGIGLAAAKRFLEEGAGVVVAGLPDAEKHEPPAAGLVACIAMDATVNDDVAGLFEATVTGLGGLDVLCHTAGGSGRSRGDGSLHECSEGGWDSTLDVNLKSVFLTNRAAVRHFLERKQPGVILNVASVLPLSPSPAYFDTCAYTAAKAGIIGLSRYAAARYAGDGIRVNVLAPGLIDTPMSERAVSDPVLQAYVQAKQPLARGPSRPEDCAEAAVYLCSDEARFVTGAVLVVDGGWSVSEASV